MSVSNDAVTGDMERDAKEKQKNMKEWWPDQLNLHILSQNSSLSDPMSKGFDYKTEFNQLDYFMLKKDLYHLMSDSKDWWPADYGNYGPFIIRMAWHSAGTYRVADGRGGSSRGTQRFSPLNSWPDNTNLDKARRLLWPIKQKYGNKISWADLMILAGNCALESMGFKTIGFAGGREDVWEPQSDTYWSSEKQGVENAPIEGICVNPVGPNGNPDPVGSAKDLRRTFARMAMSDEETVALIAGGHTFGKSHGAAPSTYLGPAPEAALIQEQGLGWKNSFGTGNASNTITSGIEGAWKAHPTTWDMGYLTTLLRYEWELVKSPAGVYQWRAKDVRPEDMVEDAFDKRKKHRPMMTTADLAIRYDPDYEAIARDFLKQPEKFEAAFARAWFKLTHQDMGPSSRYLGPEIPKEEFLWQNPIPQPEYPVINSDEITLLKRMIVSSRLTIPELVKTAWAAASSYRGSDRRGGANGGRLRLKPQIGWEVNEPARLGYILDVYKRIQYRFHSQNKARHVSIADLIVLGGCVGIELAIRNAGYKAEVPFLPGRMDASQDQTDIPLFEYLEPKADAFRNYIKEGNTERPEDLLINKAQLLTLTAPEMTVLLGGMRVLHANYNGSMEGVFIFRKNCLTNDFFVNLLDMDIVWEAVSNKEDVFRGISRKTGRVQWTASRVDLILGSNSWLRAISEVYASKGNEQKFIVDFIAAWNKVMNADRFDFHR